MTTDLDIYRTAKVLINRYGDGSCLHAASRADELLGRGDLDGRAVWLRIHEAVLELGRAEPSEGEKSAIAHGPGSPKVCFVALSGSCG